mmetsp:Transcript_3060/g.5100  ORF Transcript_3060/g.5100 Transcript_3060/m.5100 type:complete len:80 (-) Transcript_3060:215-454(-)
MERMKAHIPNAITIRCLTDLSGHTSETPTLHCLMGILGAFSTNEKCNGSGTHDCKRPMPRCTLRLCGNLDSPGTRCKGP